jgi:hypothetical protein
MSAATPLTPTSEKVDEHQVPTLGHDSDLKFNDSKKLEDFEKVDTESEGYETYNGEPIINSGVDVSKFIVDLRDDGDEAVTFRSLALGTVIAGLGAALSQVSRSLGIPVVSREA